MSTNNGNGHLSHQPAQQPEKIKLWVLMFGVCALIVLLYASYSMFFGRARQGGTNDGKRPLQHVRELRHEATPAPDHTGDFASHSNSANRDTDLPIEVKATLNGTLQRPQ